MTWSLLIWRSPSELVNSPVIGLPATIAMTATGTTMTARARRPAPSRTSPRAMRLMKFMVLLRMMRLLLRRRRR